MLCKCTKGIQQYIWQVYGLDKIVLGLDMGCENASYKIGNERNGVQPSVDGDPLFEITRREINRVGWERSAMEQGGGIHPCRPVGDRH